MTIRNFSIRIEDEMLNKISYIADYEGRSVNSHILVSIRRQIKQFESEYGKIEYQIPPDENVKLPRKKKS